LTGKDRRRRERAVSLAFVKQLIRAGKLLFFPSIPIMFVIQLFDFF
jgi:hypothetical protein